METKLQRFRGKRVFVTGGGAGIGSAICREFAEEGASVFVTDVDEERARAVARAIGHRAIPRRLDVTSEHGWADSVADCGSRLGGIDILINNAGLVIVGGVQETSLAQFRLLQSVMVEGVFLGTKAIIPIMHAGGGGSITNIASTASHVGYASYFAYCAAKGAVRAMTKAIAVGCQAKGQRIRCNSVHPGGIETALQRASEMRDEALSVPPHGILPFGSLGSPEDVAKLVLFLSSDDARFITGAEYLIDNGALATAALP